jgi:hypothetical protein
LPPFAKGGLGGFHDQKPGFPDGNQFVLGALKG